MLLSYSWNLCANKNCKKYENAYEKTEEQDEELEKLREQVANSTDSSSVLSSKLEKYNLLLGYTELIGKGVIITLRDGDSSTATGLPTSYIVHDGDLLEVVNALKNTGAEAISINEQRITSRTEISCAGNVITVNGEKIGTPFVIKAIGPSSLMFGSITIPGGYLKLLENEGVQVKVEQIDKEKIIIPKYDGVYKMDYATNIE